MSENHRQQPVETTFMGYTRQEGLDIIRAINLNNEGVWLIDTNYLTQAACAFKRSSMIMRSVISSQKPARSVGSTEVFNSRSTPIGTQESQLLLTTADEIPQGGEAADSPQNHLDHSMIHDHQLGDIGENDESRSSISSRPTTMNSPAAASIIRNSSSSSMYSPSPTYVDSIAEETTSQSRQEATVGNDDKEAADHDTKNINNNFHAIGRPLVIRKMIEDIRTTPNQNLTNISAVIIYNLALTFHLRAGMMTNKKIEMIQTALDLYDMSRTLLHSLPVSMVAQCSPAVFLVLWHNMIQIYQNSVRNTDQQHAVKVGELFEGLVNFLRMMKTLNVISGFSYEKVFIQILAVPKTDLRFAAAA